MKAAGRPKTHMTELPLYDSMEQMANATCIPLEIIRAAKKSGCTFVKHNRCDVGVFIKWYFETNLSDEEKENWTRRDKRASALIKEVELKRKEHSVIDYLIAKTFMRDLVSNCFFGELERLVTELPASLKGLNEVQINAECSKQVEQIKLALEKKLQTFNTVSQS